MSVLKITGLKISRLHNYVDYDIKFNSDITFLYGENGCGKTTVLNIITYIITGKIYELFKFQFEVIKLTYCYDMDSKEENIKIFYDEDKLIIKCFGGENCIESSKIDFIDRIADDVDEIERYYFNEYEVLGEIRRTFNYLYLPLSRSGNYINDSRYFALHRRRKIDRYSRKEFFEDYDQKLFDVQNLVRDANNKMNFKLRDINERFTDEILKSYLDIDNIPDTSIIINYMKKLLDRNEIQKIKVDYSNVLKAIKKWDNNTEEKINHFFASLMTDIEDAKDKIPSISIDLLIKLSETIKITTIIEKAENTEHKKSKVTQPLNDFKNTVNKFLCSNNSKKEITINPEGCISLKTGYSKNVNIQNLSSGEKQIVTFFAYLIFGLEDTNQGIFIVDEPELSLHLSWQRKFIDSIIDLNKNIQLIFATHSPEMIGKYREKAVKLHPNIVEKSGEENE